MPRSITKKKLIEILAAETGLRRAVVRDLLQRFFHQVIVGLENCGRVELRDFGVFEVKRRRGRVAQNPRTLAKVEVPPKASVRFKAGHLMKSTIDAVIAAEVARGAGATLPAPAGRKPTTRRSRSRGPGALPAGEVKMDGPLQRETPVPTVLPASMAMINRVSGGSNGREGGHDDDHE